MRTKTSSVVVIISLNLQLREKKKCQRGRWNLWKSKQNRHAKKFSIWLFLIGLAIRTSNLTTPHPILCISIYVIVFITVNYWILFYIIFLFFREFQLMASALDALYYQTKTPIGF